jgi:hypothetical protein
MTDAADTTGRLHIVHDDPVERKDSNYIAQIDLAPFGLDGQHEQVWLHDLADGTYALACIPFMAYGLALGDVVRLAADGRVEQLVRRGGHRTLRLLLVEDADTARLAATVDAAKFCVASAGLLSEWHGERFIAVDVPPGAPAGVVFDTMGRIVHDGLGHWEWADALPFAPPAAAQSQSRRLNST